MYEHSRGVKPGTTHLEIIAGLEIEIARFQVLELNSGSQDFKSCALTTRLRVYLLQRLERFGLMLCQLYKPANRRFILTKKYQAKKKKKQLKLRCHDPQTSQLSHPNAVPWPVHCNLHVWRMRTNVRASYGNRNCIWTRIR